MVYMSYTIYAQNKANSKQLVPSGKIDLIKTNFDNHAACIELEIIEVFLITYTMGLLPY